MDPYRLDPRGSISQQGRHGGQVPAWDARSQSPGLGVDRPSRETRKLVLCFDGTGNKFHGDDSDSNILKVFRMLDREADDQYHYYQRELFQTGMARI